MSDIFEFEDKAKVERLIGTLHDPGATTGDVLTVQADKSIAAAPGGGSMPGGIILKTYTAAEIAATYSVPDGVAALPLAEVAESQWVAGYSEIANTLDQNGATYALFAYDPSAATTDVYNSGEVFSGGSNANNSGVYQTLIEWGVSGGTRVELGFLSAGKQAYIVFGADAAPTSGSITVAIFGS